MANINKIWALFSASQKRGSFYLVILMLIGAIFESFGLGMVLPLVAVMTTPETITHNPYVQPVLETLGNPDNETVFFMFLGIFVGLFIISTLYKLWLSWHLTSFLNNLKIDTSTRLYKTYLYQTWSFHLERHSANLTQNVIKEVSLLSQYAFSGIFTLMRETIFLSVICITLIYVSPAASMVVISALILLSAIFQKLSKMRIHRWAKIRQQDEANTLKCIQESLGIVRELKLSGKENTFLEIFRKYSQSLNNTERKQSFMRQLARPVFEITGLFGLSASIIAMSLAGMELKEMAPVLVLFATLVLRILPSLNQALTALHGIRYIAPVIDTIYDELTSLNTQTDNSTNPPLALESELALVNVHFSYKDAETPTLTDVSIKIQKGSFSAFVGKTGAGKSTLIDLVLGLLTPSSGRITIDKVDIQTNLGGWQKQIGYVGQNIVLIDDTIRNNIALGVAENQIDDTKIWQSLEAAQLDEFVRNQPDKLDTKIGERGARLSGGERQRLGVARALYSDPSILILDEATSALDDKNQELIMNVLNQLKQQKTIIMITHRLETVKYCDNVFSVEDGTVVNIKSSDAPI